MHISADTDRTVTCYTTAATVLTTAKIWSWVPEGAQRQDGLTDWLTDSQLHSNCDSDFAG
jgi:hypothetical protein